MGKSIHSIVDEQTGQEFEVLPERWFDVISAWISAVYSLVVIAYLAWAILDTWSAQYSIWGSTLQKALQNNTLPVNIFRLIVYTAIGGGMGAAVNNLRSFVSWHAERRAFGWRFVWKYIALPPLGATLAVVVYGIIQGGMAVFNGGNVGGTGAAVTSLSAWATGTLAGYGSHKVFIWLDDKVNLFFKVETKMTTVPDLAGKSRDEAKQLIANSKLRLGETSDQPAPNPTLVGKVIGQDPAQGTEIACDSKVDLIIGGPAEAPATEVDGGKDGQAVKEPVKVGSGDGNAAKPENVAPATVPGGLPTGVDAAVEAAAAGVINPPDVNKPQNGGG